MLLEFNYSFKFEFYIILLFFVSYQNLKTCIKIIFLWKFHWNFHNDMFLLTVYAEKHNNCRLPKFLSCKLIFRRFGDLSITSRACRISGRLGFSYALNGRLTSWNSRCQFFVQVNKTSNFAHTIWSSERMQQSHCI